MRCRSGSRSAVVPRFGCRGSPSRRCRPVPGRQRGLRGDTTSHDPAPLRCHWPGVAGSNPAEGAAEALMTRGSSDSTPAAIGLTPPERWRVHRLRPRPRTSSAGVVEQRDQRLLRLPILVFVRSTVTVIDEWPNVLQNDKMGHPNSNIDDAAARLSADGPSTRRGPCSHGASGLSPDQVDHYPGLASAPARGGRPLDRGKAFHRWPSRLMSRPDPAT